MFLAIGFSPLGTKLLPLQINLTARAVEALRVEVLAHGFNPFVSWFNREVTAGAHGLEHLGPVCFTVEFTLLNMELGASNWLITRSTQEAIRAEALVHCIYTFPNNSFVTFVTMRSKFSSIAILTVEDTTFVHKTNVQQFLTTA
jgi:hypothetical protein